MAGAIEDIVRTVSGGVSSRWREIDPLLPELPGWTEDGADYLVATGRDGRPAGFAVCRRAQAQATTLDQTWGAATRFMLRPRVAGPPADAVPTALDQLLTQWQARIAGQPDARGQDTAAQLTWPTRDIDGILPLLRHGLQPLSVTAARRRPGPEPGHPLPKAPDGLVIRDAGPADLAAVVEMEMGVVRYDAHFGAAILRPATEDLVRADATRALARQPTWTWLAERDGYPVGLLVVQPPPESAWIATMTSANPVAYLETLFVRPRERGGGTGASLVSHAHASLDRQGVGVTILHYSQVNPVSGPFWSRMGYRPLWTRWEARPAAALR